jgi:hypothetical protein
MFTKISPPSLGNVAVYTEKGHRRILADEGESVDGGGGCGGRGGGYFFKIKVVSDWNPLCEDAYRMYLFWPDYMQQTDGADSILKRLSRLGRFDIDLTREDVCVDTMFHAQTGYSLLGMYKNREYAALSAVRNLYHHHIPSAIASNTEMTTVTIRIP